MDCIYLIFRVKFAIPFASGSVHFGVVFGPWQIPDIDHGNVIDEQELGGQTREIRKLNALIKNDPRVHICLLPIGDGLFLLQRVSE